MYEGRKGQPVTQVERLTVDLKVNADLELMARSKRFIEQSVAAEKPFFLCFNHTLMHLPTTPRAEFSGKSGRGERADCLLQLDHDFGVLLDFLESPGLDENTIVVFSGDNGPEHMDPWRGSSGIWDGSYFTGLEGSLRTPMMVRYPGVVPRSPVSNEIVPITDMFTTLASWTGAEVPTDRIIDGLDQRAFLEGRAEESARDGFPYWMGPTMYGVKWNQFEMVMVLQRTLAEPAHHLITPHTSKIIQQFQASVAAEELIPLGAPLDFVPKQSK